MVSLVNSKRLSNFATHNDRSYLVDKSSHNNNKIG